MSTCPLVSLNAPSGNPFQVLPARRTGRLLKRPECERECLFNLKAADGGSSHLVSPATAT